jgi:hypothetical protein
MSDHYAVLKLQSILLNNVVNQRRLSLQPQTSLGAAASPLDDSDFGIQSIELSVPYLTK